MIITTKGSLANHYYIGKRSTYIKPEKDKYKGSGKILLNYYKKYPNDYKKIILSEYDTLEELNYAEWVSILLNRNDNFIDERCLNLMPGGCGAKPNHNTSEDTKQKQSIAQKEYQKFHDNQFKGKSHTEETKKLQSEIKKEYFKTHDGPWKDKHLPEDVRLDISETMKKLWQDPEYRKSQCESMKGRTPWNLGISPSEETRKKQSESHKGKIPWNKGLKMPKEQHPLYNKHKVYDNEEKTEWHWEINNN